MKCLLCYNALVNAFNPRTQARKGLISYYKTYGITSLKIHVDVNHFLIYKKIEKEVNSLMKGNVERHIAKKVLFHLGFPFKKQ